MVEKCEMCGTTENIQEHHISYEPEIKQFLCVDCHKKIHGHGVGKAPGWTTLFEWLKEDAEILFKEGATNKEVSKACDISYATASHWRKKLGLAKKRLGKGKYIYIHDFPYKTELELLTMAVDENVTKATIIGRIVRDWYDERMEAKQ